MGTEIVFTGRVTFDTAIPVNAIPQDLKNLHLLEHDNLFTLTYSSVDGGDAAALTGLEAGAQNRSGSSCVWDEALATLSDIARRHQRSLRSDAVWASDPGPFLGTLVVDAGNRFHQVPEDEDPGAHRDRVCDCLGSGSAQVRPEDVTDDATVRIDEEPAGPFTDYIIVCDIHGEVANRTSRSGAVDAREMHVLQDHTPSPVPLEQRAALDLLPLAVRDHVIEAAKTLSRISPPYYDALALRAQARSQALQARHAAAALAKDNPNVLGLLLDALVEQLAATPARDAPGGWR
jgi:hypothetical protein